MTWKPMERSGLEAIVVKELAECSADLKQVFAQTSIKPSKWRLSPWSDEFGGFWAVERGWLHKRPLHARRG